MLKSFDIILKSFFLGFDEGEDNHSQYEIHQEKLA
jgi:hypothetical protein